MAQALESLPKSDDEFWQNAEISLAEDRKPESCKHTFEQIDIRNIKCSNCGVGFILDYKDKFTDGHLYREDKLVI